MASQSTIPNLIPSGSLKVPPSLNPISAHSSQLRLATWNARALLHCDHATRKRKWAILYKIAQKTEIVCIQEVHGDLVLLKKTLRRILQNFHVSHNFHCDRGTGSVITLIAKHLVANESAISSFSPAPGRILRIDLRAVFYNSYLERTQL